MASYNILIKRSAQKEIESIGTKRDRQCIVSRIRQLATDPRPPGGKKLSRKPYYRVRQGRYRIVYEVQDDQLIVHVIKVGDRKEIYR